MLLHDDFPLRDPGTPDTRSTTRYLLWLGGQQRALLILGVICGVGWMGSLALLPAVLGRAIDVGMRDGDLTQLWRWAAVLVALAVATALFGVARHWAAVHNWLTASYRTVQLVDEAVLARGPAISRTIPHGDVLAVYANDMVRIGTVYDVSARLAGAIISWCIVAGYLLTTSRDIGLLILLGGPLLLASLALIVRPLQARQAAQREEVGTMTTLAADTVGGLRILRGIGGEGLYLRRYLDQSQRVRRAGVRVAGVQAALDSAQVLLPGLFAVAVVWFGAREVVDGKVSPGELVAFYGYATFLAMPLRTVTEAVDKTIRARVAAAKVLRVLNVSPVEPEVSTAAARRPADSVRLLDRTSGAAIHAGRLTALVSAQPEASAAIAERLGRVGAGDPSAGPVLLDGLDLATLPLSEVRQRVVVSEAEPRLFSGVLRDELTSAARVRGLAPDDEAVLDALRVASATDVLDAVDGALDSELDEQARSLSGGQRQRVALARALLAEPETLVLIEPTSAVDAHTEARVAAALADSRRGRTTVIVTVSPLLLDVADEVLLIEGGRVVLSGTRHDLMSHRAYREIVIRGEDE
ncbi:ABC transporter transmembrane domain-containing protein [Janibacter sp. GXQ6167]|uniref:ABC transporter transmembrane domain-containing protein n=1 Tax=Janibacter sp. GXQ6167 TaxID=3240791 RepID=UPI00352399A7